MSEKRCKDCIEWSDCQKNNEKCGIYKPNFRHKKFLGRLNIGLVNLWKNIRAMG